MPVSHFERNLSRDDINFLRVYTAVDIRQAEKERRERHGAPPAKPSVDPPAKYSEEEATAKFFVRCANNLEYFHSKVKRASLKTEEEMYANVDELKGTLVKFLRASGKKFSVDPQEVEDRIAQMSSNIQNILSNPLDEAEVRRFVDERDEEVRIKKIEFRKRNQRK